MIAAIIGAALSIVGIALALPAFQTHDAHYVHGGGAFQLAFTAEALTRLFATWQAPIPGSAETGLTLNQAVLFPGDTLLPLGYGLFYLALLSLLAPLGEPRWRVVALRARWLPVAALAFDLAENAGMAQAIEVALAGDPLPGWLPLLTSLFGVAKYTAMSALTPIVGVALVAHCWRRPRRPATGRARLGLALAGLALLVPVSFLIKSGYEALAFHLS